MIFFCILIRDTRLTFSVVWSFKVYVVHWSKYFIVHCSCSVCTLVRGQFLGNQSVTYSCAADWFRTVYFKSDESHFVYFINFNILYLKKKQSPLMFLSPVVVACKQEIVSKTNTTIWDIYRQEKRRKVIRSLPPSSTVYFCRQPGSELEVKSSHPKPFQKCACLANELGIFCRFVRCVRCIARSTQDCFIHHSFPNCVM